MHNCVFLHALEYSDTLLDVRINDTSEITDYSMQELIYVGSSEVIKTIDICANTSV